MHVHCLKIMITWRKWTRILRQQQYTCRKELGISRNGLTSFFTKVILKLGVETGFKKDHQLLELWQIDLFNYA